jgi:hypothetical protein
MATAIGRARSARAALISTLTITALALSAGGVAAGGPPAPFTASPPNLAFPDTAVGASSSLTITISTSKNKPAVLSLEFFNGPFTLTGGDCETTYFLQVPAGTTCGLEITFTPLDATAWSGSVVISNCATYALDVNNLPVCNRTHGAVTVTYTGTGVF